MNTLFAPCVDKVSFILMDRRRNWTVRRSTHKHKKYMAQYRGEGPWIHFGDTRYEQYRDATPLRLYAHLDHGDPVRRARYKQRHERDRHVVGTAGWLSDVFLW